MFSSSGLNELLHEESFSFFFLFSFNRLCSIIAFFSEYDANITYASNTSYNTTNYYLQYLQCKMM